MSDRQTKLDALQKAYDQGDDLNRVLDKLLVGKLSQQRLLLARYDRDLLDFERRFGMTSEKFYALFEGGKLDDNMDHFEWAGLWELRQQLAEKIRSLEKAL